MHLSGNHSEGYSRCRLQGMGWCILGTARQPMWLEKGECGESNRRGGQKGIGVAPEAAS